MAKGVKVALPGYDALTDTNPAHFSLYVDGTLSHVLIKEKARGTQSVGASAEVTVAHGLAYYPHTWQFVERTSGEFSSVHNDFSALFDGNHPYYSYVNSTNLVMGNADSGSKTFTYIIFYDQL